MTATALFRSMALLLVPLVCCAARNTRVWPSANPPVVGHRAKPDALLSSTAMLPSNPALSLTNNALTVLDAGGRIVSTATVCPGYTFSQLGATGPKVSPNRHWILIDILGPYEPGNVGRNHALVQISTGRTVISPNFKAYLGVPGTLQPLSWISGERATLRYANGTSAALRDPPPRPIPPEHCGPSTPA